MRVLLTTDVAGGVWSFTEELVDALAVRGHELALVALGGDPGPGRRAWAAARPWLRFESLPFPLEWMPEPEPGLSASVAALRRVCDDFAPDVVHLSQFVYGAHDLGAPAVLTAHSDVLSWWHAVKGEPPPDDAWFGRYRAWVSAGLAGAAMRAAPSRWMATRASEIYGVAPLHAVHNARTPAAFLAPVSRRPRRVVAVGRLWDEAKGVTDLAAAAPALRVAEVDVVVAGPVRHPGGGRDFPLDAPGVTWAGRLDASGLRGLLAESAVYAATPLYEPFGLAPLEAALAGCALVMSDIPAFRELWDGCATFYPPGDSAALAKAVRWAMDDESWRLELAGAAQARALERFTPARMAAEYERIYLDATEAGAAGAPVATRRPMETTGS